MDTTRIAREFVRALRGRRSQVQFSRRLGYRSNVVYMWEAGRRFPSASEALRAAARSGVDLRAAYGRFYPPPAWIDAVDPASAEGVAAFLADLRAETPINRIAARAGKNRYSVSRWLSGQAQPRLPDFLALIDATTSRLVDWLAAIVDPTALPSAAAAWAQIEARRTLVREHPWAMAVLRALELEAYRALPGHRSGWIAETLGLPQQVEDDCLLALARAGQIVLREGRWVHVPLTVDTRAGARAGQALKVFWADVARDRLAAGGPDLFSYNVFSISSADYDRLRELHTAYFRSVRALVAASAPAERVVLANVQLVPLSADPRSDPGTGRPP